MKKLYALSLIVLSSLLGFGQNVFLVEHFDYPADSLITSYGWTTHSGTSGQMAVTNGGLSWSQTNYLGSGVGNAVGLDANGSDENKPFNTFTLDSGSVYVSFLMKAPGEVTTNGTGYFLHIGEYADTLNPVFSSISTAFRARTFVASGSTAAKFKLGLTFNVATVPATNLTADLDTGATYLVVIKYDFIPGLDNDSVSMYVFADGDDISMEPATPTLGPYAGTASDISFAQYVALRQYNAAQNVVVDGIIAQDSWNLLPSALIAPNLISPPHGTVLNNSGPAGNQVTLTWTALGNASAPVTYEWQLDSRLVGTFNPPLIALPSDNMGTDTTLTLSYAQIDALLSAQSIPVGATAVAVWRVRAISGTDTVYSDETFDIDIIRGVVTGQIQPFNLITPPNGTTIVVSPTSTMSADISWNATTAGTQAVTYEWLAILPGGSFSMPLVSLPANNGGNDTVLTLAYSAIDALLAGLGILPGASVTLEWTINASSGGTSLLASQTWQITLTRESGIGLSENDLQKNTILFPNPASEVAFVEFGKVNEGQAVVKLVNQLGQTIYVLNGQASAGHRVELDLSGLPTGVYTVVVNLNNEQVVKRLTVK